MQTDSGETRKRRVRQVRDASAPRNIRLRDLPLQEEEEARGVLAVIMMSENLAEKGSIRQAVRRAGRSLSANARRALINELCACFRRGPQKSGRKQFEAKGSEYFREIRKKVRRYPGSKKPEPALTRTERGGIATLKKYGKRHYRKMGKLSGAARRARSPRRWP